MICPDLAGPEEEKELNFFDKYFDYFLERRSWTSLLFVPNQLKKEFYDQTINLKSE